MVVAIITALATGLTTGLLIPRLFKPSIAHGAALANLGAEAKKEYAVLVAAAYAHDGDLARAQTHLERLGLSNVQVWMAGPCQSQAVNPLRPWSCHPERSEGSPPARGEMLRRAQHDILGDFDRALKDSHPSLTSRPASAIIESF
jgi:hypothetical protein